jgi:hypothetical protein
MIEYLDLEDLTHEKIKLNYILTITGPTKTITAVQNKLFTIKK